MVSNHIIAIGGGGFSMEPDNPAIDRYIISQTGKTNPSVCFLATASGDADGYILRFYKAFVELGCQLSSLSLFRLHTADLEGFLLDQDVIYVGGGNTRSMLAVWREWGLDAILHRAYDAGVVLTGTSAGANCWFEACVTDAVPGSLQVLPCLGFLPGSFCPHYDSEPSRRPALHEMLQRGSIQPCVAVEDGAAVHYIDGVLAHAVVSRPDAQVFQVTNRDGRVVEQSFPTRSLGMGESA
jgi:dipeptidase E